MWMSLWMTLGGCKEEETAPPVAERTGPDLLCPGDPQCESNAGQLLAGAAVRSIVPSCYERWEDLNGDATYDPVAESFLDCGCDARCPGDPGHSAPDEGEGDGVFQAIWVAGYQNSRPANGVRDGLLGLRGEGDGLWASVLVLDQGDTRVAIAALDAFGVMMDDTLAIRQEAEAAGLQIDYLVVHSSHSHHAPDSLGIYGPNLGISGYNRDYLAEVRASVIDALIEATSALEPVSVEIGSVDANDYHESGVGNIIADTRDPVIIDPLVSSARFIGSEGQTIATAVHFSNHPEELADEIALMTSNFVHALRETVRDGLDWGDGPRPGVGGTVLYLNGTVGGMMTSLGAAGEDPFGVAHPARSWEKSDTIGQLLGSMALDAVASATVVADPKLSLRREELFLPVENNAFQAMFIMGTLSHRSIFSWDPEKPIGADNRPEVQSEVGLVSVGPLSILCLPGEPLPELAIGGYDGAFTPPNQPLVDPNNINPPDLTAAPLPPYLHEAVGAPQSWVLGLASDQIGYVIPEAHFEVGTVPYLIEADGDHYEETNSLGRETAPRILSAIDTLLGR